LTSAPPIIAEGEGVSHERAERIVAWLNNCGSWAELRKRIADEQKPASETPAGQ